MILMRKRFSQHLKSILFFTFSILCSLYRCMHVFGVACVRNMWLCGSEYSLCFSSLKNGPRSTRTDRSRLLQLLPQQRKKFYIIVFEICRLWRWWWWCRRRRFSPIDIVSSVNRRRQKIREICRASIVLMIRTERIRN